MNDAIELDSAVAWELEEDQLYAMLGEETDSVISGELSVQAKVFRPVNLAYLIQRGEQKFWQYWETIKAIVCSIHIDGIKSDGKDLVAIIAAVVIKALGYSAIWIVFVVTIAVKRGLDKLCAA